MNNRRRRVAKGRTGAIRRAVALAQRTRHQNRLNGTYTIAAHTINGTPKPSLLNSKGQVVEV